MNNTISVYELLGLIKDGKAPHSILFKNEVWFFGYNTYTTFECLNKTPDSQISLFSKYRIDYCLNDIVEIIDNAENKPIIEKIEKLSRCKWEHDGVTIQEMVDIDKVFDKVNELIDVVNELKKEVKHD